MLVNMMMRPPGNVLPKNATAEKIFDCLF